jgi:hypothetical protein
VRRQRELPKKSMGPASSWESLYDQ